MRNVLISAVILAALTLSGCESTPKQNNRTQKSSNTASLNHRVTNFRAVLRQASSDATFILVNEGHALRKTRDGRKELALNSLQQAYKALTAKNIDGLLTMFKDANASLVQEPWKDGDEKLIMKPLNKAAGIRGVIMIENNGQRYKLIGRRPTGTQDVLGRERYMTFSKLKRIFFYWDTATSRAERADSAMIGGPEGSDAFDLKRRRN